MIISCNYLNLSLADEHVGDVTIPTQVIKHNQNFLQPIRLKYSNQIKLFRDGQVWLTYIISSGAPIIGNIDLSVAWEASTR